MCKSDHNKKQHLSMNVRRCAEHEVSITKSLRGFHFVKVVGATPWLCQWHGLQDMTEASSFHQLRLQMDSLGHVYMVAFHSRCLFDCNTCHMAYSAGEEEEQASLRRYVTFRMESGVKAKANFPCQSATR